MSALSRVMITFGPGLDHMALHRGEIGEGRGREVDGVVGRTGRHEAGDRVLAEAFVEDEAVGPDAAVEAVVARPADQPVVAGPAGQGVDAGGAVQVVVAGEAVEDVGPGIAGQLVVEARPVRFSKLRRVSVPAPTVFWAAAMARLTFTPAVASA